LGLHGAGELGVLQTEGKNRPGGGAMGVPRFTVEHAGDVEVLQRDRRDGFLSDGFRHLQDREGAMLEDHVVFVAHQDAATRVAAHPAGEGYRECGGVEQADDFVGHGVGVVKRGEAPQGVQLISIFNK